MADRPTGQQILKRLISSIDTKYKSGNSYTFKPHQRKPIYLLAQNRLVCSNHSELLIFSKLFPLVGTLL